MRRTAKLFRSALLANVTAALASPAWADVSLNAGQVYTVSGTETQGSVNVGEQSGPAILNVLSGGFLNSGNAAFGVGAGAGGNTGNIQGTWSTGALVLGDQGGNNTLNVSSGGEASAGFLLVGKFDDAGSNRINLGGGVFRVPLAIVDKGSDSEVTVSGAGSAWINRLLILGNTGGGNKLTLLDGGVAEGGGNYIVGVTPSSGFNAVTVAGHGSAITVDDIRIGSFGSGNSLTISDGGKANLSLLTVGEMAGAGGNRATVSGPASQLDVTDKIYVGLEGSGNALSVLGGATAAAGEVRIGAQAGAANNSLLVSGPGSSLASRGDIWVGAAGGTGNSLTVERGGSLSAASLKVAPGNAVSVSKDSAITTGSLAVDEGATLAVQAGEGSAPRIVAAGVADLRGTIEVDVADASVTQNRSSLITAAEITGTPALAVTTNQNLAASFRTSSTEVWLEFNSQLGTGTALGRNQQEVANVLDDHFNAGGSLSAGFGTLYGLTGEPLNGAIGEITGEVGASGGVNAIMQATDSFLTLLAGGTQGGAAGRTGHQTAATAAGIVPAADAPPVSDGPAMWGAVLGGSASLPGSAANGSHDTDTTLWGVAAGWEQDLSPDTRLGLAVAGGQTGWDVSSGLGSGDSTYLQIGTYGRQQLGAAYVSLAAAYAWHALSTERTVHIDGVDRLRSDFDASNLSGRAEAGYRVTTGTDLDITPYAALQAQGVFMPRHDERGGAAGSQYALSYDGSTATALRSELGIGFDTGSGVAASTAALYGRVAWAHDWTSDADVQASFQSLGPSSFTVTGAAAPDDVALVSAGASLGVTAATRLAAGFDGEFGQGYQSYAGSLSARYSW